MTQCDQRALKAKFGVAGSALAAHVRPAERQQGHRNRDSRATRTSCAVSRTSSTSSSAPLIQPSCGAMAKRIGRSLELEAEKLGVREHVVFRGQFVSAEELRKYLQAADVFVSPYLNEAQVTSGALSYAMGAGAAVVSTPYWHAEELLVRRPRLPVSFQGSRSSEQHAAASCSTRRTSFGACVPRLPSSRTRWRGRGSATGTSKSCAPPCARPSYERTSRRREGAWP